jgi:hypothetical protein
MQCTYFSRVFMVKIHLFNIISHNGVVYNNIAKILNEDLLYLDFNFGLVIEGIKLY